MKDLVACAFPLTTDQKVGGSNPPRRTMPIHLKYFPFRSAAVQSLRLPNEAVSGPVLYGVAPRNPWGPDGPV
jgi:hypothetical protein